MNEKILEMLRACGVPAHIKGYNYLKSALGKCVADPEFLSFGITKVLYPTIAKEFHTTSTRVERAIRHAVTIAFDNMPMTLNNKLFGNTLPYDTGKATNMQFIATIAEAIRNEVAIV